MAGKWMAGVMAAAVLTWSGAALAHEGHAHKALGTIHAVHAERVEIKTTDGKTLTVTVDAKTAITRGKEKLAAAALKTGERVSVEYMEVKKVMVAHALKLGSSK